MMTDLNKGAPALFFIPVSIACLLCKHKPFLIPVKFTAMGFDAEFCSASCVSSVVEFLLQILMKDFS